LTDIPDRNDAELARALAAGDEAAFVELYRRRQAGIYRYVLHMTGSPALAEDVTQEVFLALIRQAGAFDETRGSLAAYLYGVARHLCWRGRGRQATEDPLEALGTEPEAETTHPLDALLAVERTRRVRSAVASLPPHYREVVLLCELEGLTYGDAAAALGQPIGTVRSRLHRARALLTRKLKADATSGTFAAPLAPSGCTP
jgi:RNA polymerase sigma-70 factor (ECF subfamily)